MSVSEGVPEILISNMQPHDLRAIVQVHIQAFPDIPSTKLGGRYVTAFMHWFASSERCLAIVAYLNREPVGYAVGSPDGYQKQLNYALLPVVIREVLFNPRLVFSDRTVRNRLASRARTFKLTKHITHEEEILRKNSKEVEEVMKLVSIGVSPSCRRKGVARMLMENFESQTKLLGFSVLTLSVAVDNSAARKLYESCGWIPSDRILGDAVYYIKRL